MKKHILAAIVLALSFASTASADCYSSGVRQGYIQKFSQKGLINKSWEGEMVQEGIRGKGAGSQRSLTNIWKFSVTSASVAAKMDEAVFEGKPVTVKYCQSLIRNPLTQNTSYEVTAVRVLE
jgi:hypothetical protein